MVSQSGKCGLYSRLIACAISARDVIAAFSVLSLTCQQISGRLNRVTTLKSRIDNDYAWLAATDWKILFYVSWKENANSTARVSIPDFAEAVYYVPLWKIINLLNGRIHLHGSTSTSLDDEWTEEEEDFLSAEACLHNELTKKFSLDFFLSWPNERFAELIF